MATSRVSVNRKGRYYRMAIEVLTREAAEFLGVTVDFIIKLVKKEKIKGQKKGRDWWIDKKSLEAYQKKRRPAGRPVGTVSSKPARNRAGSGERAEREREYQRDYKRRLRAGEIPAAKKGAKRLPSGQKSKRLIKDPNK